MEKKKYRIIKDLCGVRIIELNISDGTEDISNDLIEVFNKVVPDKILPKGYVEMTDEELADKITELKLNGIEVEKYHQVIKRNKLRNVKDY